MTGAYALPIKIAAPYPNLRCLGCHGESQRFLKSEAHGGEVRAQLVSGAASCLDCHAPAHTPKDAK